MFLRVTPLQVVQQLYLAMVMVGIHCIGSVNCSAQQESPLKSLLSHHCERCHSGDEAEGGFRVESLSADFANKENRDRWLAIQTQLKLGRMPPKDEPSPSLDEQKQAMEWIGQQVDHVERLRRQKEGRVVLRRLNREEYANTLRDLLGIELDLSDLMPPETSTTGFDNDAEQLHTSSFLMSNYLDAADRALDEAIANEPEPWILKKRFDIRDEKSVKPTGSVYRHTDDGVAIFATWESANIRVTMWNFRSHVRGKYRFRISGYGFQSEGKPVAFRVTAGTLKEVTEERLIDYFSVPADEPTVVEFTEQLEPENRIRILAEGLPALPPAVEKIGADKYSGPGLVIQWVDVEGPILESWPPPSHKAIFDDLQRTRVAPDRFEVVSADPMGDAKSILLRFAKKAFRRDVSDGDIAPYLASVQSSLNRGYSFEKAIRVGLKAILISPDFLFLREKGPRLDDFEIANRLSYFLWSSMPDEELFQLAAANKLHEAEVLHAQVERLLRDSKSKAFNTQFTGQWLGLRAIDATMPDGTLYPEYDDILKTSMLKETSLFFEEVLQNDLPVTHFIHSDFSFLNERLAKHYGISGVTGMEMRKVALPNGSHRGGLLTMGSILKVTANGTTTSPVIRGAWVLERILGTPPPKPPNDVEAIEPDIRGSTTIRKQLEKHRNLERCAACHREIDPPGFALENFDVIGGWREKYRVTGEPRVINGRRVRFWNGPDVEPGYELSDGRAFANIDEYKQLLLANKDQIARNLIEKLLAYGTGAAPASVDGPEMERILQCVREEGYGFRSLIHEVVRSELFQTK